MLDTDIFGYALKENYISIQIFHIRNSKMVERSGFLFEVMEDEKEMYANFVNQFYFVNNNPIPKEIVISNIDIELIDERIRNKVLFPQKGKKKELLKLVTENALEKVDIKILKEANKYERTVGALIDLEKLLGLNDLHVLEAFDNSNIQGTDSVSAMVSYVDGVKNPKGYRKFKVKTVLGSDDTKTMYEVVSRRYSRLKKEESKYPDIILIDGGKGQVSASKKALDELGINIPILGLVKDDNHRTDHLLYNDRDIYIDKKSNLFLFLESVQDEVHRYAITFHHQLHGKKTFASALDNIKGIGKVKKMKILEIVGKKNFEEELMKLKFNEEQTREILKIFNHE